MILIETYRMFYINSSHHNCYMWIWFGGMLSHSMFWIDMFEQVTKIYNDV